MTTTPLPRRRPGGNPVAAARKATGTWNAFAIPRPAATMGPQSDGAELVAPTFHDGALYSPEFTGDREDDGCWS